MELEKGGMMYRIKGILHDFSSEDQEKPLSLYQILHSNKSVRKPTNTVQWLELS